MTVQPVKLTKFNLSADLSFERINREVAQIVDEVLSLINVQIGVDRLAISLEVTADNPKGFDVQTVKNVMENCRVLGIKISNFDS